MRASPLLLGAAFCVLAVDVSAEAQRPQRRVLDLNRQAMDAYTNLDLEHSDELLQQALQIAEDNDVADRVLARTYLNLGVVYVGGYQDNARGMDYFSKALEADPDIQLDPLTSTPEIREVFKLAKRSTEPGGGAGGGGGPGPGASGPGASGPGASGPGASGPGGEQFPAQGGTSSIPHQPVPEQLSQTPVPVYIENLPESPMISELRVYYKGPGMESFEQGAMRSVAQGYGFEIPCETVFPPEVTYYIVAVGEDGSPVASAGSEDSPITVSVVQERSQPPPSLPGQPPPQQCSMESECPPGMPCDGGGGTKGLGDTCRSGSDCREGLRCDDNFCVADDGEDDGGEEDGEGEAVGEYPHFFVRVGLSNGLGWATSGMQADSQPPDAKNPARSYQCSPNDPNCPSNNAADSCGAPAGNYCVRVEKSGFLYAPALRGTVGYYIIDRLAVAATFRYQFNAGQGTLANILLGARAEYDLARTTTDSYRLNGSIHLGSSFGQIQLQPPQSGAPEPYIISGLNGVQVGGTFGMRFLPDIKVGWYLTPELHFLFPTFMFAMDLTAGVEIAY